MLVLVNEETAVEDMLVKVVLELVERLELEINEVDAPIVVDVLVVIVIILVELACWSEWTCQSKVVELEAVNEVVVIKRLLGGIFLSYHCAYATCRRLATIHTICYMLDVLVW